MCDVRNKELHYFCIVQFKKNSGEERALY